MSKTQPNSFIGVTPGLDVELKLQSSFEKQASVLLLL